MRLTYLISAVSEPDVRIEGYTSGRNKRLYSLQGTMMSDIDTIVQLSHEFGTERYVRGGGGNTSCKNKETLWVKPSGTTLAGLTPETFVVMNREKIDALYSVTAPEESAAREAMVKVMMEDAVENDSGRPSVEAPLHNVFAARYVVHTHPAWVNGLTCAVDGTECCSRLFPDALWVEYVDPGYTLCMVVRRRIDAYRAEHGVEPSLLFLQNHGIFVAADSADEIRGLYAGVMATLKAEYSGAAVPLELYVAEENDAAGEISRIQSLFGDDAAYVSVSGRFEYAPGPLSPDHMVYSRAFPFTSELTESSVTEYKEARGYAPKVVITDSNSYGIGPSKKNAKLALELARDGAMVMQFTKAFGGVHYMTDRQRAFIENWEVESYRQQQVE